MSSTLLSHGANSTLIVNTTVTPSWINNLKLTERSDLCNYSSAYLHTLLVSKVENIGQAERQRPPEHSTAPSAWTPEKGRKTRIPEYTDSWSSSGSTTTSIQASHYYTYLPPRFSISLSFDDKQLTESGHGQSESAQVASISWMLKLPWSVPLCQLSLTILLAVFLFLPSPSDSGMYC